MGQVNELCASKMRNIQQFPSYMDRNNTNQASFNERHQTSRPTGSMKSRSDRVHIIYEGKQNKIRLSNYFNENAPELWSIPTKNKIKFEQIACTYCHHIIKIDQQIFRPKCKHQMHVKCLHQLLKKSDTCLKCANQL